VSPAEVVDRPLADVYPAAFAGAERVQQTVLSFGRGIGDPDQDLWSLVVAPGVLQVRHNDLELSYWANRRAIEPHHGRHREVKRGLVTGWTRKSKSKMVLRLATLDWSYLEQAVGIPAMITLTYPADWLPVAQDGAKVKRHLKMFCQRWERAWGESLRGAWKLEFQARGAPHIHIGPVAVPVGKAGTSRQAAHEANLALWEASGQRELARQVALGAEWKQAVRLAGKAAGRRPGWRDAVGDGLGFSRWLAVTWADVVSHPDPEERAKHEAAGTSISARHGLRCTDPKRLAVYFSKHGGSGGGKEYQHQVPEEWRAEDKTPGRFWGYWGIEPVRAAVPLGDRDELLAVSRALRKLSERSHRWNPETRQVEVIKAVRQVTVWRRQSKVDPLTGEVTVKRRRRKVRRPVRRLKYHRGFVCMNDAPAMAAELVRLAIQQGEVL
jgi:hypothetical protein